jgi:hypothetical protein
MSESAFPVFAKLITEAEREKCAQLCESYGPARVLSGEDCDDGELLQVKS